MTKIGFSFSFVTMFVFGIGGNIVASPTAFADISRSSDVKELISQETIKRALARRYGFTYSTPKEDGLWETLKNVVPKEQKHFVIVTPSFNNKDWYKKNLDSICYQSYTNYHIIYIDDASTDGTASLVDEYLKEHNKTDLVTVIRNNSRRGHMYNFYNAIYTCDDDSIVVVVDGDDWLAHKNVLALLNKIYDNPDVWMTYGQFKIYPTNVYGFCRQPSEMIIQNNAFRRCKWIFSHLRTFYAWLFKKIDRRDLSYESGEFITSACDLAIMFPMLEMAGTRSRFVPDILTIYNNANPLHIYTTRKMEQKANTKYVRSLTPYLPLKDKFDGPQKVS